MIGYTGRNIIIMNTDSLFSFSDDSAMRINRISKYWRLKKVLQSARRSYTFSLLPVNIRGFHRRVKFYHVSRVTSICIMLIKVILMILMEPLATGCMKYGLLTKREVKMAGYWPSSFFACLWTKTKSRSINTQKKNEANIQPS